MPRISHFEIHADNVERAAMFYTTVFGWEIKKWDGPFEYWMVMTGEGTPGINGGLVARKPSTNGDKVIAFVCSMDVDDVDGYIAKVEANGGQVVVPKYDLGGMGWLVYCKDTEGNIFGMMQPVKKQ